MHAYRPATVQEWCSENGAPYREFSRWAPSEAVLLPFPGLPGRPMFAFERPRMFIGRISNVDCLPPSGYLCTSDRRLIFRALGSKDFWLERELGAAFQGMDTGGAVQISAPEPASVIEQECVFLGGTPNFGHFFFQHFLKAPLLTRLPELRSLPVAVYGSMPKRYFEFLDLLGIPASRRIVIPADRPVRFGRLWIVSSPMYRRDNGTAMIWPEAFW
jgi:hypothetical protein